MPLQETLELLDLLTQGKTARDELVRYDSTAQSAFGGLWRGERSEPSQLQELIEWQGTIKDNGDRVRRIALRSPDRQLNALLLAQLSDLNEVCSLAQKLPNIIAGHVATNLNELSSFTMDLSTADRMTRPALKDVPNRVRDRLQLLDKLGQAQSAGDHIDEHSHIGLSAFGSLWQGRVSRWPELRHAVNWVIENTDILKVAGEVTERSSAFDLAGQVSTLLKSHLNDINGIASEIIMDLPKSLGGSLESIPLSTLIDRFKIWSASGESLFQWTAYRDRAHKARNLGCDDIVKRLEQGSVEPDRIIPAFEMAYYETIHKNFLSRYPELSRFDGALHSSKIAEFAQLDLQRIRVSADETVRAHYGRLPPRDGGAIGPLGVLRSELQKRRGHMPIRKLVERAGPALQALKPVFMMSPLSVAQFLAPGAIDFDLLIMDEASQIQPVDALGAVARARQVVVVGDPRQLPPTSFFARMTGGGDDDEDDGGRVTDIESILGLFIARGLPVRMLRWHYRSRHQSLIAVSNRQFYESKLFVVPSPYTAEAGMGLRFHHITDGLFDAGAKRSNVVEAKVVAKAIIEHALSHSQLSLGVAAFSVAQRRAILDELELLRRANPETEGFFHAHPSEPFFVKNLENVQGDERDVIFISVGYGPTVPGGRVPMRFGPLGSEGGERRLNVLISRAKQRCEVFASMTDDDISPDFATSRKGIFAFRMFLQFARTGQLGSGEVSTRDLDGILEEEIAKALHARGYHVHRQVGLAGIFISLAVSDPERPGRYLIGIECDGASYNNALSARDRDRLRQSVLESHGWHIHRIWSTDWFQRPQQELERVIAAIELAKAEDASREVNPIRPTVRITSQDVGDYTLMSIRSGEEGGSETPLVTTIPFYQEAILERLTGDIGELHQLPTTLLASFVEQVVNVEGPVHVDEVVTRIRESWGLKRAGARIRDAIETAVQLTIRKGSVVREGDFLTVEAREPALRDRSAVTSTSLRKPEMIPLSEIIVGAIALTEANFGATAEQLVTEIARAFGFKATSEVLRARIIRGLEQAQADGRIVDQQGLLRAKAQPS